MPRLVLPNVLASTGGMYTCVVTNEAGSDDASTFLYVSPYFITQPRDTQTSDGSSVTLLCEADAFPSPEIVWLRTDLNESGEPDEQNLMYPLMFNITRGRTLIINPVLFGDEGEYYCIASSLNVTLRSADVTVTGE